MLLLPMRQKRHNIKGYVESMEVLPALGLYIFKKKSVATCKLDPWFARLQIFFLHTQTHTHIYTDTKLINLPCSLLLTGNKSTTSGPYFYHIILSYTAYSLFSFSNQFILIAMFLLIL